MIDEALMDSHWSGQALSEPEPWPNDFGDKFHKREHTLLYSIDVNLNQYLPHKSLRGLTTFNAVALTLAGTIVNISPIDTAYRFDPEIGIVDEHFVGVAPGDVKDHFYLLADRWLRETEMCSSSHEILEHAAYGEIIDLGWSVLPYVLREIESDGDRCWLSVMEAIAGDVVLRNHDSIDSLSAAWLDWGRSSGYID